MSSKSIEMRIFSNFFRTLMYEILIYEGTNLNKQTIVIFNVPSVMSLILAEQIHF